jgi:hypothetical protein
MCQIYALVVKIITLKHIYIYIRTKMNKKPKPTKIYYKIKTERTWLQTYSIFKYLILF